MAETTVLTKQELLELLNNLQFRDPERDHVAAEEALLRYINDPEITAAWNESAETWWYA